MLRNLQEMRVYRQGIDEARRLTQEAFWRGGGETEGNGTEGDGRVEARAITVKMVSKS